MTTRLEKYKLNRKYFNKNINELRNIGYKALDDLKNNIIDFNTTLEIICDIMCEEHLQKIKSPTKISQYIRDKMINMEINE